MGRLAGVAAAGVAAGMGVEQCLLPIPVTRACRMIPLSVLMRG